MPYSIVTKDGIRLDNIPDEMDPNAEELKVAVAQRRSEKRQAELRKQNPGEYDPSSPEFKAKFGATSGMGTASKLAANVGAGATNFGRGLAQLALPKGLEEQAGITDASTNEKRARDEELARSVKGGRVAQIVGEGLPTMAIPGGTIAKGIGMLPRVGQAAKAAGIGTRALPTAMAEGAAMGAVGGAATNTLSTESTLANTIIGSGAGALLPAGLAGLGKAAQPVSDRLTRRSVAKDMGGMMDVSPRAQRGLAQAINQSNQRMVNAPQSTATLTQNMDLAGMEMAARANPKTAAGWAGRDQQAADARWDALDSTLGNEASVDAARDATNAYAAQAVPTIFRSVKPAEHQKAMSDFASGLRGQLNKAVNKQDPSEQTVYGYIAKAIGEGDGSLDMMWNIRKTLSGWLEGRPPPGMEGTRAAKMDRPLMTARAAIDTTLNRSTNGKWSKFLTEMGEQAKKEGQQKAGQNIRNMFVDETLGTVKGPSTVKGNPAVTRARLDQGLARYGQNKFGETLDWPQRDAVDQVTADLRADEILQRAKSAMTGRGGSQTAPLLALMEREGGRSGAHWIESLGRAITDLSAAKKRQVINEMLQSPEDALSIMRMANEVKREFTPSERLLLQAARSLLGAGSSYSTAGTQQQVYE